MLHKIDKTNFKRNKFNHFLRTCIAIKRDFFVDLLNLKYSNMKHIKWMLAGMSLLLCYGCSTQEQQEKKGKNTVIETIMSRRSIRKYTPQAISRDTMQIILDCGINAPNGQNKQSWEIRVVDNPEFINGITEIYKKENPKAAKDPNFKNMFRNASTVVFIANDLSYDLSQIDCGLLGENMILSAWSMGIGSCCLGGPTRFMINSPAAAEYLKKLDIPEGYQLLYCIAFGYPDETPAAKPRDHAKIKFIE